MRIGSTSTALRRDCQTHHLGVVVGGRLHVVHNDGAEAEVGAGEAYNIEPGHDAWVVGDEPCVAVDFGGYGSYAKG